MLHAFVTSLCVCYEKVFVLSYDAVHYIDMDCQEKKKNYLLLVVCAIFKKAYWNGGRIATSNWTAPGIAGKSVGLCQLWDVEGL